MKIKTVWHWRNILKATVSLGSVMVIWFLFITPMIESGPTTIGLSILLGVVIAILVELIWEPYHFEEDKNAR